MSTDALSWALRVKTQRPAEKLVLIHLGDVANHENEASPSITYLSANSSLTRRTITTALDCLEDSGMISDTGRRVGSTLQVKVYRLNVSGGVEKVETKVVKEELERRVSVAKPDWLPQELIDSFKEHRRKLKKPMSDLGITLFIREVEKLKEQGHDAVACVEASILNGWLGVYAPKHNAPSSQQWVTK